MNQPSGASGPHQRRPVRLALPDAVASVAVAPRAQMDRNASLDVLRSIAVLLVMVQHGPAPLWCKQFGWSGVDLFFVLSGFLVTGLLLAERRQHGDVQVGRFLIRRGFKIYPPLWLLLAATVVAWLATGRAIRWYPLLVELSFLQSYGPSVWPCTWSLAVEEHFYLASAAFFWWQTRRPPKPSAWPVKRVLCWLAAALLALLFLRIATRAVFAERYRFLHRGTHVRLDSLLFGTLLAYLYDAKRLWLETFARAHRPALLVGSLALLLPWAILGGAPPITRTVGYTALYLGYGGLLLVALSTPSRLSAPWTRALAFLGRHSYCLYLFHQPLLYVVDQGVLGPRLQDAVSRSLFAYITVGLVGGLAISFAIEAPMLRLRDRLVPRRGPAPVA